MPLADCIATRRCIDAFSLVLAIVGACACVRPAHAEALESTGGPGSAGKPYPHMPAIAPIAERIGKYLDVPPSAKGPASTLPRAIDCRTSGEAST